MAAPDEQYSQCIALLQKYWGHQQFRPLQIEIIQSVSLSCTCMGNEIGHLWVIVD